MSASEQQFIELCKIEIGKKFFFGNGSGYTQRDLELLSDRIEQKTGVVISLSTLKRLWRDDYKQSPQLATLNALAMLLDYQDWHAFKIAHQGTQAPERTAGLSKPIKKWGIVAAISLAVIVVSVWGLTLQATNKTTGTGADRLTINGPIHFEAVKTMPSGIPNTVIFKYDVSNVVADSFFIQQSWNNDHKVKINPTDSVLTSLYFESGFHRARLIANDSMVAMQPVHILSNGWEPHIYRHDSDPEIVDLKNENFVSGGLFHLDSSLLAKRRIDFAQRFHTRITNSQVFDVHSDSFTFVTRMKADRVMDQVCPWMDLVVVTDVNSFSVTWTAKGCEERAGYKLGEIYRSGSNNDLSSLGCDVYAWQELTIHSSNRKATIYLNGKPAFEETYKQDFGKIRALIYIFDGTGSIDYARLKDGKGRMVFQDEFEK